MANQQNEPTPQHTQKKPYTRLTEYAIQSQLLSTYSGHSRKAIVFLSVIYHGIVQGSIHEHSEKGNFGIHL